MKLESYKGNYLREEFSPVILYLNDLIWLENALKGFKRGNSFRFMFSYKDSTYVDNSASELVEERNKLGITELDDLAINLTGFKISLSKSRNSIMVNLDDDPEKSNYYKVIGFLRDLPKTFDQRIFLFDKNDDLVSSAENIPKLISEPEEDHAILPLMVRQPQGDFTKSPRGRKTLLMDVENNSIIGTPKKAKLGKYSLTGFLSRNKDWIEIIAGIATIVGLIILIYQVFTK